MIFSGLIQFEKIFFRRQFDKEEAAAAAAQQRAVQTLGSKDEIRIGRAAQIATCIFYFIAAIQNTPGKASKFRLPFRATRISQPELSLFVSIPLLANDQK